MHVYGTTKKISLTLCLLLFFSSNSAVWSQSAEKQAVLAALTLNLARFTSWPEQVFDSKESTLNLCIIGDNIVQQAFTGINHKTVNSKTLRIINLSRFRNLSQCHLLYVSELDRNKLIHLLLELKGQPILTVGETMEFLKAGGMVSLEKNNGKIQLNINLSIIKQSELVVSSRILKLAKIFNFPYPIH